MALAQSRGFHLVILSLVGFVTSFGAHVVATNLPTYAQTVGAGAMMIGLLIAVYDFAELFAKPAAGFIADRHAFCPETESTPLRQRRGGNS
jgi:MFS family permease